VALHGKPVTAQALDLAERLDLARHFIRGGLESADWGSTRQPDREQLRALHPDAADSEW
jgi:hypothetical protein